MDSDAGDEARMLVDWVETGVVDAIKRRYLKRLFFGQALLIPLALLIPITLLAPTLLLGSWEWIRLRGIEHALPQLPAVLTVPLQ